MHATAQRPYFLRLFYFTLCLTDGSKVEKPWVLKKNNPLGFFGFYVFFAFFWGREAFLI